jgi:hypothetical protein
MHTSHNIGTNISAVEVINISQHGIWLYVENEEKEFFLSYGNFPWFKDARVRDIMNVSILNGFHIHWPALDIDIELESIKSAANYPLIYR